MELLEVLLLIEIVNKSKLSLKRIKEVLLLLSVTSVNKGGIVIIESYIELQNLKILYIITCKP